MEQTTLNYNELIRDLTLHTTFGDAKLTREVHTSFKGKPITIVLARISTAAHWTAVVRQQYPRRSFAGNTAAEAFEALVSWLKETNKPVETFPLSYHMEEIG